MTDKRGAAWLPAKCRVPMWSGYGHPDGFCDKPAFGHQLPREVLVNDGRIGLRDSPAYCHGHACAAHGGPREHEIRIFQDGYTEQGRPMWCAVFPDFENLQESPASFDGDPVKARAMVEQQARAVKGKALLGVPGPRDPSDCRHCDGFGVCWNNADPTSGQWAPCDTCNDTRGHP